MPTAVRTDRLRELLLEHLGPESVETMADTLRPFYEVGDDGYTVLAKPEELDVEEVKKALELATGMRVSRILFVSQAHPLPFPKPEWMTDNVYEAMQRRLVGGDVEQAVRDCTRREFVYGIQRTLGVDMHCELRLHLSAFVSDDLPGRLPNRYNELLADFLYFKITRKDAEVARLAPLVRLLPKVRRIGEKKGELGTWLVLCA